MIHRPSIPGAFSLALALATGCGGGGGSSDGDDAADDGATDGDDDGDDDGSASADAADDDDGPDTGADDDDGDASATADDGDDDDGDDTGDPPVGECGEIVTFEDGLEPTTEIHVATNGNDGGGCGAADSPCATIEGAAGQAAPGTAIRVHAGTYAGGMHMGGLAGSADAPIWIGGAPGEDRPVIEGGDVAFQMSGARYVVVHDLEVRNMTLDGINVDDGGATADPDATRFVVMRGLFIHDIGTGGNNDCLKLSGVNDFAVIDAEFSACGGSGSAIDMVGCHHGVVAYSSFHDMATSSANSVQTKGGSEDVEIYANTFVNAGERAVNMGGSTGFEYFRPPLDAGGENAEARDIRTVANTFAGSDSPIALVGCTGCLVAHNTVVDPQHWVFRILQETASTGEYQFAPSGDNTVVDNIVVFSRDLVGTVVNIGPDTAPETFTFSNNLWYAQDSPDQSDPGLPVAEQGGIVGVDPALAADLTIAADSPAAGAGAAVRGLRGDHRGDCWGEPPSIGAFEVAR
jgi:hypothetical protein